MIFTDRNIPSPITTDVQVVADRKIQAYYETETTLRRQSKLDLDLEWRAARRQVQSPLRDLFYGKCAFCESLLPSGSADIDHFRPRAGATDLRGTGSLDHYGWLSLEWQNLYPVCGACNRSKRSLFPVVGARARPLTTIDAINGMEETLLLDPCRDQPDEHLEFSSDGSINAITKQGEATIRVFNLNRTPLRDARREVFRRVEVLHRANRPTHAATSAEAPYAATARSAVASFATALKPLRSFAVPEESRSAEEVISDDEDAFRLTARPLESISIRNFRMLREVDLRFPEPRNDRAPWLMLLGENASGKSTLLQAIALALAGAEEASRLTRPGKVVSAGAKYGQISLRFWDNAAPVELSFRRGQRHFQGTQRPSAMVLGYGSLRYPDPRARETDDVASKFARISALIKPVARMPLHRAWLGALSEEKFDALGRALKEILPIQSESLLLRKDGQVFFQTNDHVASLTELSAGYQAMVAVCLDIMRMLFERWETLQSATAVVIIDEIDAHLHPRWKMRVVSALRSALPQVQFIASTHDPLVLRGLRNGEVALMERDEDGAAIANRSLPPIEGMMVDDLLVSRHFGLSSTIDPTSEGLYNEYYHLLSLPSEPERNARIAELRARLGDRESFGRNQRENLFLEASEAALADDAHLPPLVTNELKAETIARFRTLASRTSERRRG